MSTMKDSERLDLLKEIGGTKVYEERRRESLKIMQENEIRKNQIQEVVRLCGLPVPCAHLRVAQNRRSYIYISGTREPTCLGCHPAGGPACRYRYPREAGTLVRPVRQVEQLDEKLGELDAEREELHKYQQLDKQKRGLEYAVYDKELSDARKKLDEVGRAPPMYRRPGDGCWGRAKAGR